MEKRPDRSEMMAAQTSYFQSSIEFSGLLLEHLGVVGQSDVWTRAEKLYRDKLEEARKANL
ncbi:hypothetical protein PROFUN_14121 [Planoprotostelium fungivorum]|uniref:Uncharacterized protein n=1 Tax=Planoprotostelium fungivorum TaxID=1890364 RepID=A0A2P6N1H7_9EUKA|nr:hypothetical protein PROFUN_14121 [Planoprotostelium fungivorum]